MIVCLGGAAVGDVHPLAVGPGVVKPGGRRRFCKQKRQGIEASDSDSEGEKDSDKTLENRPELPIRRNSLPE